MALTTEQLQAFVDDGYVVVPKVISDAAVRAALRAINASIGRGFSEGEARTAQAVSSAPELQRDPSIMALIHAAEPLVEALLGEGNVAPATQGQIALRYPTFEPQKPPVPHIDGRPLGTNGVDKYRNFSTLVGVFLKDVAEGESGNLVAWPGTHRQFEQFFRVHGIDGILRGEMPEVDLPQPRPVLASAGDVLLAHYQLGHGVDVHRGPDIRYVIYFRMKHVDHDGRQHACLTDIWLDYDGVRKTGVNLRR